MNLGTHVLDTWTHKVQNHKSTLFAPVYLTLQLIVLTPEAEVASLCICVVHLVVVATTNKVLSTSGTHALLESLVNVLSISTDKVST